MTTPTVAVLDAVEVTQSIQDLQHSVTLIAGKATVIRAYVNGASGPATGVTGTVTLLRSPNDPPVSVTSTNTVSLDPSAPQDVPTRRADATLSLNFVVPPALTDVGGLNVSAVSLTDTLTGADVPFKGSAGGPAVWFHPTPPLRVRVLGLRYRMGNPPLTYAPRDIDHAFLISWLKRAYPVAEVIEAPHATIDATATPPFQCTDTNAQLAAIRALDISAGGDRRTHYIGQVADGGFFLRGCASGVPQTPDPTTVASSPCGAGTWNWDFDGSYADWYGGHELGHTYGRKHPGFCSESKDDLQDYPFRNGQLADDADSFVGFDVGDPQLNLPMAAKPGVDWHDVMTYCNYQWPCSYTYEGIRQRLADEDALTAGAPAPGGAPVAAAPAGRVARELRVTSVTAGGRPDERFPELSVTTAPAPAPPVTMEAGPGGGPLVSIVGTVDLTNRDGAIRFVNPVRAAAGPPAQPGTATSGAAPNGEVPVVLRVQQTGGGAPTDFPVTVKLTSDPAPGQEKTGLIDAVVPIGSDPASVELLVGGQVVDTFRPADPPPALRGARQSTAGGGRLSLDLDFGSAPPTDGQTFATQVSTDGGQTWQTVGVGLKDPMITVDRSQFPPGTEVRVRVIATNGFTSTTSDIESFRV
ncbi:hypothetical protein [Streptomyces sp. NRRL S-350]|uniref:hypothetical protein n=1 Tax=Streptomyces sp. NRRL S-350 TaxID=1463902 RepID=UPI00131C6539|nr:hypothetical protein [Streptomyces sp. NRRL S-350]